MLSSKNFQYINDANAIYWNITDFIVSDKYMVYKYKKILKDNGRIFKYL